jgi:hypothetical protein
MLPLFRSRPSQAGSVKSLSPIALWGMVGLTLLSACSGVEETAVRSSPPLESEERVEAKAPESLESPPQEAIASMPQESGVPFRADDIRQFLAQGSIEDTTLCPSESAANDAPSQDIPLKVAYFETTHYWIEICTQSHGGYNYYGRKRDNPDLDLAIVAYPSGDRPHEFIAQNGNTRYHINPTELMVTQNGVPIIREPVTRAVITAETDPK